MTGNTSNVLMHNDETGFLRSRAACRSHILILPSYAPLTMRLLSNLMHLEYKQITVTVIKTVTAQNSTRSAQNNTLQFNTADSTIIYQVKLLSVVDQSSLGLCVATLQVQQTGQT